MILVACPILEIERSVRSVLRTYGGDLSPDMHGGPSGHLPAMLIRNWKRSAACMLYLPTVPYILYVPLLHGLLIARGQRTPKAQTGYLFIYLFWGKVLFILSTPSSWSIYTNAPPCSALISHGPVRQSNYGAVLIYFSSRRKKKRG